METSELVPAPQAGAGLDATWAGLPGSRSCFTGAGLLPGQNVEIARIVGIVTIQAATIIVVFDGINRVADATGIRLDPASSNGIGAGMMEELGMQEFPAARS